MINKRYKRGFTLVEMLVVIGIIAVLAAILLPVIWAAQRKAHQASCQSNLHQIALALRNYKNDFRGYPLGSLGALNGLVDNAGHAPGANDYNTFDTASGRKARLGALYPNYLQEQKLFFCPEEGGTTILAVNNLNTKPVLEALDVDGSSTNFASSTYDDYYNYWGYKAAPNAGDLVTAQPAPATRTRNDKFLANLYAPDTTVITYCREHEETGNDLDLVVRLGGTGDRVHHGQFAWDKQPETTASN